MYQLRSTRAEVTKYPHAFLKTRENLGFRATNVDIWLPNLGKELFGSGGHGGDECVVIGQLRGGVGHDSGSIFL